MKNCYAVLKVDEEVVDEKDDIKKVSVVKKAAEEHQITYNVNDITIDEMVQHINDYKKNDVIANAPEEIRNEKKNSSDSHKNLVINQKKHRKRQRRISLWKAIVKWKKKPMMMILS